MNSYSFIHSEQDIRDFVTNCLLPCDFKTGSVCTIVLLARRKYDENISGQGCCVAEAILDGPVDVEKFVRAIKKFEVPSGTYVDLKNNYPIPNHAFAIYVDLEPKDTIKTLGKVVNEVFTEGTDKPFNVYKRYKKLLRSTNAKVDVKTGQIDLDTKDPDKLLEIKRLLVDTGVREHIIWITETRSGYHIAFKKHSDIDNKALYQYTKKTEIRKKNVAGEEITDTIISITSTASIILAGTSQGGFCAKRVNVDEFFG